MSVVIADGIVVIVTWTATYRTRSEGAPALLGRKTLLSDVLLRNGSIYFVVLTVLNILHLAFSLGSIAFADARMLPSSVVGWFTGPLTSILLSAFLADLRAAAREGWRTESGSEWSSVAFGIGSGMREEGDSDGQDAEIRMAHSGSPDGELTTDAEGWRSA
ncbi:hypothetical protein BD413DRAFT_272611 [Trametes elegans]|nr:hypothetical protein BD413DRAFT_272611 [Trametes elegans]